jgi:hypothetical protein
MPSLISRENRDGKRLVRIHLGHVDHGPGAGKELFGDLDESNLMQRTETSLGLYMKARFPECATTSELLVSLQTAHVSVCTVVLGRTISQNDVESLTFILSSTEDQLWAIAALAGLFLCLMRRRGLNSPGWGWRRPFFHLARLRYHTLVTLWQKEQEREQQKKHEEQKEKQKEGGEGSDTLRTPLRTAFREWREICTDRAHVRIFGSFGFQSVEREARAILCGPTSLQDGSRPPLLAVFRDDASLRRQADQLLADWFIRDRYALGTAAALGADLSRLRGPGTAPAVKGLLAVAVWLAVVMPLFLLDFGWSVAATLGVAFRGVPIAVHVALAVFVLAALFGVPRLRTPAALMVPRLWVAILVAYFPLLLTETSWKAASATSYHQLTAITVVSCALTYVYFLWEVASRLSAAEDDRGRARVRLRAFGMLGIGIVASCGIGLALLDTVGTGLATCCLGEEARRLVQCCTVPSGGWTGCGGVFGCVHPSVLLTFSFTAMCIGVLAQIFWPVTTLDVVEE